MEPFELNPEKIELIITARRAGKEFRLVHELRPPTESDWLGYDKALAVALADVESIRGGTMLEDESLRAASQLWDGIVLGVQGYFPDGAQSTNWKSHISPTHKNAAVDQLLRVWPQASDHSETFFDAADLDNTARVAALRGGEFTGLVHTFRPPSVAQRIEYDRLQAETIIVRGQRKGKDKVVIPPKLKRMIALYNDLIQSVSGYSISGRLELSLEEIRAHMDAQHKRAAVQALFNSGEIGGAQDEAAEEPKE